MGPPVPVVTIRSARQPFGCLTSAQADSWV